MHRYGDLSNQGHAYVSRFKDDVNCEVFSDEKHKSFVSICVCAYCLRTSNKIT